MAITVNFRKDIKCIGCTELIESGTIMKNNINCDCDNCGVDFFIAVETALDRGIVNSDDYDWQ